MSHSRRTFIQQISTAAAVGLLSQLPARHLWAATPTELVPEPDEALLRALALAAVEAARAAGATFADVRVTGGRQLAFSAGFNLARGEAPGIGWPSLNLVTKYGVRAVVDGAWGFAGGDRLTPDAVVEVARTAVARARTNRPRRPRTLELAPVPRVTDGKWATPIERDPFIVPVGEQSDVALAALAAATAVPGVRSGGVAFVWTQSLRVFASSEGTLTVQRVTLAAPSASVVARAGERHHDVTESVEALVEGGYGYEAVTRINLVEELRRAAERAVAGSRAYTVPIPAEVGRYDLVLGGHAVAQLLSMTLAEALNLERALGYQANGAGTSFAAPPAEIVGKYQLGSKLLTVRADRTHPHAPATVGWDDEGVPAGEHTIIEGGTVMDYLSNRQCAPELAAWYESRGTPARSHGCASGGGHTVPRVRLPNLTLEPGKEDISVEALIADTRRGFYIERCGGRSDQQLLNTQAGAGAASVREIRQGKLGARVEHLAFQFITPGLWKSMDAIGGSGSVVETQVMTGLSRQDPLQLPNAGMRAVPARVRQVNVLNIGRTA